MRLLPYLTEGWHEEAEKAHKRIEGTCSGGKGEEKLLNDHKYGGT